MEIQELQRKVSFIDLLTTKENSRYSREPYIKQLFREGTEGIFVTLYEKIKKRISRLPTDESMFNLDTLKLATQGELAEGESDSKNLMSKADIKLLLHKNKELSNGARGMLSKYAASSNKYLPTVYMESLYVDTPLTRITKEKDRFMSLLDDVTKPTDATLMLIKDASTRDKMTKLLTDLDAAKA